MDEQSKEEVRRLQMADALNERACRVQKMTYDDVWYSEAAVERSPQRFRPGGDHG